MSWTALFCPFPCVFPRLAGASWSSGRRCHADMRALVTAGRGIRLEGCRWSSNVGRHRWVQLSIGVSRVSSTLPSHPHRAREWYTSIHPFMPVPVLPARRRTSTGQFPGNGNVGDDPAFVSGFEMLPPAVQPVVALMAANTGRFVRDAPAGAHVTADVVIGPGGGATRPLPVVGGRGCCRSW